VQHPYKRRDNNAGMHVRIFEKRNQKEGITTDGIVSRILTNSSEHPHGIKVQLRNGAVGRVKEIINRSCPTRDKHFQDIGFQKSRARLCNRD